MSDQGDLFSKPLPRKIVEAPKKPEFDGQTYYAPRDKNRLTDQKAKMRAWALAWTWQQNSLSSDPKCWAWFTLEQAANGTGVDLSSVPALSARLRDFRKKESGSMMCLSRHRDRTKGLWEYLLIPEQLEDAVRASGLDKWGKWGERGSRKLNVSEKVNYPD